jgi:hypothetical protein
MKKERYEQLHLKLVYMQGSTWPIFYNKWAKMATFLMQFTKRFLMAP